MSDIVYRIKVYSNIQYNVGLRSLQSDNGGSDIRLSPILLITDFGLNAQLCWKDNPLYIAGHRHRGNKRRNRHSGIHTFSPVPDQKIHDCVGLLQYRICPGIVIFFIPVLGWLDAGPDNPAFIHKHRHTHTHIHTHTPPPTPSQTHTHMEMQHGNRHAPCTRTSSMDMDMKHGMDMEMDKHNGCRNADEKFSPALLVFR
jgi:ABC-type nickel/cobalt efflux system permease component RcnA